MSGRIEIATISASRQFGLVTYAQLARRGASRCDRRPRRRGRIEWSYDDACSPVAASSDVARRRRVLAAVLAGGDGAFASHESAARLWACRCRGRLDRGHDACSSAGPRSPACAAPQRAARRSRCHVRARRSRSRVAGAHDRRPLGRDSIVRRSDELIDDALRRGSTTLAQLDERRSALGPCARSKSQARCAMLDSRGRGRPSRRESVLEDFVYDALRRFELPLPVPQYRVRGRRAASAASTSATRIAWLALEAKGFEYHGARGQRFDDDALRGNELQLAGFRVLEFTVGVHGLADRVAGRSGARSARAAPAAAALTFVEWLDRYADRLGSVPSRSARRELHKRSGTMRAIPGVRAHPGCRRAS